ncbi:helix-turn-helix domain-containing protein [Sphingomonas sp.]|uniref:helix-turn-helix domain-containing protein n=1 Tax=Sphingomonas sp. TaxID=28214 RepID=UPI0035C7F21F
MSGRPTSFKPEFVEQARKLAALGATDREAAEFFDVAESTLYLWKHTQPEFSEALKVGKDAADERVVQSLYRKAVGYSFDSVKYHAFEGCVTETPCVEHVPPSDTAAIFWLKNRKPAEWRDKTEVAVDVTDRAALLAERRRRAAEAGNADET